MAESHKNLPAPLEVFEAFAAGRVSLQTAVEYLTVTNRSSSGEFWNAITVGIVSGWLVVWIVDKTANDWNIAGPTGLVVGFIVFMGAITALENKKRREEMRLATHLKREMNLNTPKSES